MEISLRKVNKNDEKTLLVWANDLDSIKNKIDTKALIDPDIHKSWFLERLSDQFTFMWIILNKDKKAIGQLRLEEKIKGYFDIDIFVEKTVRRKGVAFKALKYALYTQKDKKFRAIVKKSNERSYKFFINSGFKTFEEDNQKWVLMKFI